MAKIRFTKGELKRQRDALRQYERYLPVLQLKKQQLQMEILRMSALLEEKKSSERRRTAEALSWAGLLADKTVDIRPWVKPVKVFKSSRNVAGTDLPAFERLEFAQADYDLFIAPLWVDAAIEALKVITALREEIRMIESAVAVLRQELRIATQRVNLFEKIKIPEAEEAIRVIKIYMGDQMANAVGRSKIAKRKIEAEESAEVNA
jgi:V/A-type H+-transporting ATPase subunit D